MLVVPAKIKEGIKREMKTNSMREKGINNKKELEKGHYLARV